MFKLKATAVAVALAASGAAQAITIDNTDLVVNIVRNGLSGDSMVVNTDLNAQDVQTGAITSYSSDPALTTAISDFIGGASDVRFWVTGRYTSGFDKFFLSNKSITDPAVVNAAVDSSVDTFITNANSQFFDAAPNNYVTGIPDGNDVHYNNSDILGNNNLVAGTSLGSSYDLVWSQSGFFAGTNNGSLSSFNLSSTGELSYGVSAVPVPAAVWLFGSGLVGLVGVARRRQQK